MKTEDYGIGEVCEKTGLSEKQLRYWEEKKFIPLPKRIVCGERAYRRYDEDLVEIIRAIKGLMDEGLTLQSASKKAQERRSEQEEG